MSFVYAGKLLRFDLNTGRHYDQPIAEEDVRRYLLGSGLASKIYYDEMDPSLDPLDPASPLLIVNGLLSGTFAPTGCRSSWCGRSPLTGIWNEANMGGHWGAELRAAGYDGLILTGRAPAPVYLWIDGRTSTIELRDAQSVWGLDHFETHDRLLEQTDPKARVASLGQAGENLVKIAGIMQGGHAHARSAARGGMGALMGSKNLKAIVLRGADKPAYADPKGFRDYVKSSNNFLNDMGPVQSLHFVGTAGGMPVTDLYGDLPIDNWRGGNWTEGATKVSGKAIHETGIFARHTFCHACPIGCGKAVDIKEGEYAGTWGEGPEYETMAGFGGNLMCDDLNAVSKMNDLCNRYGMDTISTSGVITFAFEAFEKGAITEADTGGIALRWGDAWAIMAMIHKIALRQDIGDVLAEGVREAARRIGDGSEAYALHVKGLELPYHDPRSFVSMACNYATANRGACHLEAISYWRGIGIQWKDWQEGEPDEWKARLRFDSSLGGEQCYHFQNYMSTYNPLGLCKFITKGSYSPAQAAELVNKAMGWQWTQEDLLAAGERLFNLKRLINVRFGIRREDDTLPERMLTLPRPTGTAAGVLPDLDRMLADYYRLRRWDENGIPTAEAPLPDGVLSHQVQNGHE